MNNEETQIQALRQEIILLKERVLVLEKQIRESTKSDKNRLALLSRELGQI